MKIENLERLPMEQWKILRVIKVIGPDWCKFNGLLPYVRDVDKIQPFNFNNLDVLDEKFLEAIKKEYPDSRMYKSYLIMRCGELEEILSEIKKAKDLTIKILFTPELPTLNEISPKEFAKLNLQPYEKPFKMRMGLYPQDVNIDFLIKSYSCTLSNVALKALITTISPV